MSFETSGASGSICREGPGIPDERKSRRLAAWSCIALIVVAVVAAYANGLRTPFIFDDTNDILGNRSIRHLWPLRDVFFHSGSGQPGLQNRPVVNLSWAVNYAMGGGTNTLPYHLTNLAIHVLAALALFGIVRRTLALPGIPEALGRKALPLALAVALLWALHPLQTQAVTYIVQRYESLMGLFYLLALYGLVRAGTSARAPGWAAVSMGASLLAMGSKEVAVSAPLCLLLYDRAFLAGSFREAWARRRGMYEGLLGVWVAFAVLQLLALSRSSWSGFRLPYSWREYALSQFGVILNYLRLSLWPHPLVLDYGWPVARTVGEILPGAVTVTALVAVSVYALVRRPKLGFLGAWFFLILAPTSSILPLADLAFLHRMYLPLAAVVVLAMLGGQVLADTVERRGWLGARGVAAASALALALVAAGLAAGTWQRNRDYATAISIWRDTAAKAPRNPRAHYNLGWSYSLEKRYDKAIEEYDKALEIHPNYPEAHNNLGAMLAARERPEEAIAHFRKALEIKDDFPDAHVNLGIELAARGEMAEAMAHYRRALVMVPDHPQALLNLGTALAASGDLNAAIPNFEKALEVKPDLAEAHYNLGYAYTLQGKSDEAIAEYRRALGDSPAYADAHNNLGAALLGRGEVQEAIVHFRRALEIRPDYADARRNLENALAQR